MSENLAATLAQVAHEIATGGAGGGRVVFSLAHDAVNSPYRARGVPSFLLSVQLSWLDVGFMPVIDLSGRQISRVFADACVLAGSLLCSDAPVALSIIVADARHIPPPSNNARLLDVGQRLAAALPSLTPAAAAAIRAPWAGRTDGARRRGHLARADAVEAAGRFEVVRRGVV